MFHVQPIVTAEHRLGAAAYSQTAAERSRLGEGVESAAFLDADLVDVRDDELLARAKHTSAPGAPESLAHGRKLAACLLESFVEM